jgi:hypothetical protein
MITPEKLRELATYSIGTDLQGRIDLAAKFQEEQRQALLEAAAIIENMRPEKSCDGFSCPYTHGSAAVVKDTDTSL